MGTVHPALDAGLAAPQPSRRDEEPGFAIRPVDPAFDTFHIGELRHDFHRHPLMQLPQLARLARELYPRNLCRFIRPGASQLGAFSHSASDPRGLGVDEVFARIEEPGSWIALYQIEEDPTYRAFLEEVMASVMPIVRRDQGGTILVHGFVFISAPPSVTPFHIDRENNFWLQVRGRKTLTVFDHRDRDVVPASEVERFILYGGGVRIADESLVGRGRTVEVAPGQGMYWPSTSPHMTRTDASWTSPGDGVCISIGINFYTPYTRRHGNIRVVNGYLRRLGIDPREPGCSPLDGVKAALGRALVRGKQRFRGYVPKPGLL